MAEMEATTMNLQDAKTTKVQTGIKAITYPVTGTDFPLGIKGAAAHI